jgi:hypothetical protein
MTSRSFINTIATIAIAEAQTNVLMKQLPADDLEKIRQALLDVNEACEKAYAQWLCHIDSKGMRRLNRILDAFQSSVKSLEMVEFTSTALALLESLRSKLTERKAALGRIEAIANLISAFYSVHEYFDPDLSQFESYRKAAGLELRWAELMEG